MEYIFWSEYILSKTKTVYKKWRVNEQIIYVLSTKSIV